MLQEEIRDITSDYLLVSCFSTLLTMNNIDRLLNGHIG